MSDKIILEPVWVPNHFPEDGRLELTPQQIEKNYKQRQKEKRAHRASLEAVTNNCCRTLHISFFFDGTNNNRKEDMEAKPETATNITRLFEATREDAEDPGEVWLQS